MNLRRLVLSLYLALFAAMGVAAGLYFVNTQEEYRRLKVMQAQNRRKLDEAEKRLAEQRRILERLRTDPAYVEMVIRRNLGYAKPDEAIFKFDH